MFFQSPRYVGHRRSRSPLFTALICILALSIVGMIPPAVTHAAYESVLLSPTPPAGSQTFVWRAAGAKPGPGAEISHIELRGCWTAAQVTAVTATDITGQVVGVTVHSGGPKVNAIETDGLSDSRLPVQISVTFSGTYGSTATGTDLFIKTGGGRSAGAHFDVGGPTCLPPSPEDPDSESIEQASLGDVAVLGVSPTTFNAQTSTVQFAVTGATLSADPADVRILHNDTDIPASAIQIAGSTISLSSALQEGRNDLVLLAADSQALVLSAATTIWAGPRTLTVSIVDELGQPFTGATVTAQLSDDPTVQATASSVNGQVSFPNLPNRTILLTAEASGNRFASAATYGAAGFVQLRLKGFDTPSAIANNDFSFGTDGWNIGSAPVQIVPHTEAVGPSALAIENIDQDLMLGTAGEGPQSVSRTFQITPGTSGVTVRYRFITSEVPGGYFGSEYNDYYNVSIRSFQGGGSAGESQSMNGLGLAAFDGSGATNWRTATLPVAVDADTVQVDITVANVADGLYDSQVVIDFVAEEPLSIRADRETACPNQTVTFRPNGSPTGTISWTGGGTPPTGTGNEFATRFSTSGEKVVEATRTSNGQTSRATARVQIKEASGSAWVNRFPTSRSTGDLAAGFQGSVNSFISAVRGAGAAVTINATYRPVERAYLMHYAFRIAREGLNPNSVQAMDGVDICWLHYDTNGNPDVAASRAAAEQMVQGYDIVYRPALQSRHTQGRAIDMNISWSGTLVITNAQGQPVTITSTPRTGMNSDLWAVGASYGVRKHPTDRPHWSDDGR